MLQQFPDLTKPPKYQENPPHDVVHHIITTGPPVYEKCRRLRHPLSNWVKEEFKNWISTGVCRPSSSQWASPIVIVSKDENNLCKSNDKKLLDLNYKKLRVVGDYTKLNQQIIPDRYPLPNYLFDSTNELQGASVFSKIDLVRAYFNIPIAEEDIKKTAVISPAGLYEFLRMIFGLRNAPSSFVRFIHQVLGDLPFVFAYIDDLLIFSRNLSEHYEHLLIVFQRLDKYKLTLNLEKCEFCVPELDFLGHRITKDGFRPTDQRVQYIKNLVKPKTIHSLRRILGTFNFYRRFVKQAAETLAPLNNLLKGKTGKKYRTPVPWTSELEQAFEKPSMNFQIIRYYIFLIVILN